MLLLVGSSGAHQWTHLYRRLPTLRVGQQLLNGEKHNYRRVMADECSQLGTVPFCAALLEKARRYHRRDRPQLMPSDFWSMT